MSDFVMASVLGFDGNWTVSKAVLLLMLVQLALIILCLIVFAVIMLRKYLSNRNRKDIFVNQSADGKKEHTLIGITLDVSKVQRTFKVGESFNCDGLIVIADYKEQPITEPVYDYTVNTPTLFSEGVETVSVGYGGFTSTYTVNVERADEIAEPVIDRTLLYIDLDLNDVKTEFTDSEPFDYYGLKVVAHYSAEPETEVVYDFTVDAPDMTKEGRAEVVVHYGDLAQTYPIFITRSRKLIGITLDLGIVRREFVLGERFYADGLIVIANYDVAPFSERVSNYEVEAPDMSEEGQHIVTVKYLGESAIYTISVIKPEAEPVEEIAAEKQPLVIEEESVDAGILRYDRSFTARLIQSDDDTKHWYTMIKNELLSYKKIKDRMSWKKETYKYGKQVVARLGYRGKTLCLFLALDYAEFVDTKYKLEDVSVNKSFADTPCMYRIRNERRVKYAYDLIAKVMEKIGTKRIERISQDYYLPYEGVVELINKKLIKRNIKSSAEEAIFVPRNAADDSNKK